MAGLLAITGPCAVAAEPQDPWLGSDKALHFGFSAGIAAGGYGATALVTDQRPPRLWLGGGLALAAGLGKEGLDAMGPGDASAKDLVWDIVGTATGLGVAWVIDWLLRP